jgi:hypothetical protein
MTGEKVIKALRAHDAQMVTIYMEARARVPDITVQQPERNLVAFTTDERIGHLRWMIQETIGFVHAGRLEKAMRWLGFIQGALWVLEISTIEESKRLNMPDGEAQ